MLAGFKCLVTFVNTITNDMKKYYSLLVTKHDLTKFRCKLMLSELHILSSILKEHKKVLIQIEECSKEDYQTIFNV